MKTALTLILLLIVFVLNTFAQDIPYTTIEGEEGHTGSVYSVAFSPDGQMLASGGQDNTIRLWEISTGRHLSTLEGHGHSRYSGVYSVAFSPNGKIFASGSSDKTIRLWEISTGRHLDTFEGHTTVYSVAFSPDGQMLASGGQDNTIRLWEISTGRHLSTLEGHVHSVSSVAFSPNGKILASGSDDKTIRLWDLSTGKHKLTLQHKNFVSSIAFSPDGKTLASGSDNGTVYLWDLAAAIILWNSFDEITVRSHILTGHTGRVSGVSFSPDGQTLASSNNNTISLWDVSSLWKGETDIHRRFLTGHTESVSSVAFSPNGQTLASGSVKNRWGYSGEVRLWDVNTGNHLHTFGSYLYTYEGRTYNKGSITSIAFSPDSQTLASGIWSSKEDDATYGEVRLWDVNTGNHLRTLEGRAHDVSSIAFSSDGQTLATGVNVYEVSTGRHLRSMLEQISGHTGNVNDAVLSPNWQTLAIVEGDTVRLYDVNTGNPLHTLEGHTMRVNSVAFSPNGQMVAVGNFSLYREGNTRLWDAETGELLHILRRGENIYSVAFSPDGKIIATAVGGNPSGTHLWNVGTGQHLRMFEGGSVIFSPDGKIIATRSGGHTVLWDTNTGRHLHTLEGGSVIFSPDGKIIATVGSDRRSIRLWELPPTRVSITPNPVVSPAIGEQFTINVSIVSGENVGGYQVSLAFDPTALRYVESANGDYLQPGAFFVPPVVSSVVKNRSGYYLPAPSWYAPEDRVENAVTLGATSLTGISEGDGTLATVTFEVLEVKESIIDLFDVILTDNSGEHLLHFAPHGTKVETFTLPSSAVLHLTPSTILSPAIGEHLTLNVEIAGGQNVADYQLTYDFDESALKYISKSRDNYLAGGIGNGDGTLETVTFEVLDVKASSVNISGYLVAPNGLRSIPTFESAEVILPLLGDVNRDGVVNILDLVQVASSFAQPVPEEGNPADVNEDGVVNIVDLVKVAGALGGGAAAPSAWHLDLETTPTRTDVQQWLSEARQLNLTDATSQRGILFLQNLLAALTPKETILLPNYPNPFNPETWIPYQLAAPADVTVTIYAVDGTVVRTLPLGHQPIGIYQGKSRAAYWDGRNEFGEPVASGVYFYTLTAGNFTATRKMLIRK